MTIFVHTADTRKGNQPDLHADSVRLVLHGWTCPVQVCTIRRRSNFKGAFIIAIRDQV